MAKIYLGLDASTQSMSALAVDAASGEVVYSKNVNFGADLPWFFRRPCGPHDVAGLFGHAV